MRPCSGVLFSPIKGHCSSCLLLLLLVVIRLLPDNNASTAAAVADAGSSGATDYPSYCLKEWTVAEHRALPPLSAEAQALNLQLQQVRDCALCTYT